MAPDNTDAVALRLGSALRQARDGAGVKQAELARRLGVIPQEVNRWEAGRRSLSLETIEAAEKALGVRAGTVLRLAGFVDDGGLVDVDTIAPEHQESVRLLLEASRRRQQASGDGVDGQQSV